MSDRTVAVVTGDVNASSRLTTAAARRLEDLLQVCFDDLERALPATAAAGFSSFRGDSWQFVVAQPAQAVRAALYYRAVLLFRSDEGLGRRLHSAAAIGFGTVEYLPGDSSRAGGGEAYTRSGKRLDRLRRRVPGMGAAGLGDADGGVDVTLGLIDALARHWTAAQGRAVSLALQRLTQDEIARRWQPPITQQAVHKHLLAAGWAGIEPAIDWLETTIEGCI